MKLDVDQLQVSSFEAQEAPAVTVVGASGEDCFTRLSYCCSITLTLPY